HPPHLPPASRGPPLSPVSGLCRPPDLAKQGAEDFVVLREAPLGLLREDEPPVGDYVVLALRALDRLRVEPLLHQLSRETRGSFVVTVSDGAVEDLDAHAVHRNDAAL